MENCDATYYQEAKRKVAIIYESPEAREKDTVTQEVADDIR